MEDQLNQQQDRNSISSLTQENATESNAIEIPSISLPKGGGALKGIDEKFEVNAANGTATFNIPLPITPGRNGFSPSLTLGYNSGAGNGPYGLGWSVDYPSVQRKTDKRLPRYRDGLEEDVFMFSGAEDLVPYLVEDPINGGFKEKKEITVDGFTVRRYRPRIEGGFARIEKINHINHGCYWKVTTRDNIATIFGRSADARIVDPEDPGHIYQWLPEFSYDDKGNWIQYHYKKDTNIKDDGTLNVDESIPNHLYEKNRKSGLAPFTNTYLKRITYGNRIAYYSDSAKPYDPQLPNDDEHFFELVMDYGEHTNETLPHEEIADWEYRDDAFSSFRSGFEIRTNRLCNRILMFHHFNDENQFAGTPDEEGFGENYLVRSLDLDYEASSINNSDQTEVNYLKSITQRSYIKKPNSNSYSEKSLPPMEFTYQKLNWNKNIRTVSKEAIVNAPVGLTNNYQWVDLYGEGISGILTEQGEGWYYKSNFGDVDGDGEVAFSVAQKVIPKPSFNGLSNGVLSIQDLEANGEKQVVVNSPGVKGYYELTDDNDWKPFKAFEQIANIDLQDPNTRLIDLNGDGQPELVITEENVFTWYAADGKRGYLPAEFAHKTFDEEQGPAIIFADQEQTIFLADMSGDGLTDIVRIRNGEVCYWANMGYGKFSSKISMSNAPLFDHPDLFNLQYLHLADVSGTGATDIIYLGKNEFKAFINLSGNAWSDAHEIKPFLQIDSNSKLSVIDLLGTGTSCIVWSSDLPAYANAPMRYIDLMDSKKPHVLIHYKNNMGMETSMEYKSSTHFYLEDKLAGKPWITKLPFAVQVVSKQIVEEKITDVRFTSEYRYHHGYYDHPEGEFRGFGMVEQIDTELYEEWEKNNAGNQLEKSETHYQKPVLTKTWFHTGAFIDRERILDHFKEEHWFVEYNRLFPDDPLTVTEPELVDARLRLSETIQDHELLNQLSIEEWREALRACKGMTLRQEIFAVDADLEIKEKEELKKQAKPYTVTAQNCHIQLLQPKRENQYGVFMVTQSEGLNIQYERNESDSRIAHTLNIKMDELGNVLEAASVMYPRNAAQAQVEFDVWRTKDKKFNNDQERLAFEDSIDFIQSAQTDNTHIIYSQSSNTNDVINDKDYLLRVPSEVKTFEITGLQKSAELYQLNDFNDVMDTGSSLLEYHQTPTVLVTQRRIIEHVRSLYYNENLDGPLLLGELPSHGITFESYQLAYTPALVQQIYGNKITDPNTTFGDLGKYTHSEGDANWWIRSGLTQFFDPALGEDINTVHERFFTPISFTDPFGSTTQVAYYKDYFLFIESTRDELANEVKVDKFDFRSLSPVKMRDINDNISEVILDELGMVKATALLGKDLNQDGIAELELADNLNDLEAISENEEALIQSFFQSEDSEVLRQLGRQLLKGSSSRMIYDLEAYRTNGKPVVAASISRETHHAHLGQGEETKIQMGFEYSDGGGNVVMAKAQAEPGLAKKATVNNDGTVTLTDEDTTLQNPKRLRWIGNGRTILNNKGNPVKQYEPYFSVTPFFEDAPELVETGVTPILYYDSMDRNIRTKMPDKTFTKVEFDSWKQLSYDPNDTIMDSEWFTDRIDDQIVDELIAAGKDPVKEKTAAEKAAKHDNTPGRVFLDNMGRPVLSIEHNRNMDEEDEFYNTRIVLDIEGNPLKVIDARGNTVMEYQYDMLGQQVHQKSMDAGERWMFNNLMGNPVHSWDERNHIFEYFYDEIQRPTHSKVVGGDGLNHVINRVFYGETEPDAKLKNIRGQVIKLYDTGGLIETPEYDFKGQPKSTTRKLFKNYKEVADWTDANLITDLENDDFIFITKTDALGRITKQTAPDGSIITPSYNEAGLLNSESVEHTDPSITTTYIKEIDYNEKGQRNKIIYGNDVFTNFHYDKETFRLKRLVSNRENQNLLQDLHYTYDPVGNITHIEDKVNAVVFFRNNVVKAESTYTYDALYRLVHAAGRENDAALSFGSTDNTNDDIFKLEPNPDDPIAMRDYEQSYLYDPVGNINQMIHDAGTSNSWTRTYAYESANNRLKNTKVGQGLNSFNYEYTHHAQHGFITKMPHLQDMGWNFNEELVRTSKQKVSPANGTAETTYYQYDGQGQRIRKITENSAQAGANESIKEERIYVAGFETYRKYQANTVNFERESLSLMDEDHRFVMVETVKQNSDPAPVPSEGVGARLVRYQLHNHIGSASLELDGTDDARVISYEEYHPYGTTAYQAKNTAIKSAAKRYRFTGMERDDESGLSYHSARYYLPWLGRWGSVDPEGIESGINFYTYSYLSPVIYQDSSGEQPEKDVANIADQVADLASKLEHEIAEATRLRSNKKAFKKSVNKIKNLSEHLDIQIDSLENLENNLKNPTPANNAYRTTAKPSGNRLKELEKRIEKVKKGIGLSKERLAPGKKGFPNTSKLLKVRKVAKLLGRLTPIGTVVGVVIGVNLIAQGEVWAGIKELASNLPVVSTILAVFDIGSSIFGFFSGSGSKSSNKLSDSEIDDLLNSSNPSLDGLNLLHIDLQAVEEPGNPETSSESSTSSNSISPRLIDLNGSVLKLQFGKEGNGTPLLRGPDVSKIIEWDEYLILDLGLGFRATPNSLKIERSF